MILPILLLCLFVLEAGAGFALTRIDLPRYRPIVFRLHLLGSLAAIAAVVTAAMSAHLVLAGTGIVFLAIGIVRSRHYHAIRSEFDIPPPLRATGDEPKGPDKKARERKEARRSVSQGS